MLFISPIATRMRLATMKLGLMIEGGGDKKLISSFSGEIGAHGKLPSK